MSDNDFVTGRKYFDNKYFPRGFRRSGEFTRAEAQILEDCGVALRALMTGEKQPETEAEKHFMSVVSGEIEPETPVEKAWIKYMKYISQPRLAYVTAMSRPVDTDDLVDYTDFDMD